MSRGFEFKMAVVTDPEVSRHAIVFYDGDCGLCQGFVRFLLVCDRKGRRFLFSPLQGHLIRQLLDPATLEALPDTLVLRTVEGRVRIQSEAVLGALDRLGGFWRAVGILGRIVPRRIRDFVYAWFAATRRRIFGGTHYHCPLVPAELRDRFVD
jgi:predicted DCC family thiol-disulfide oxidoreductase YuxK